MTLIKADKFPKVKVEKVSLDDRHTLKEAYLDALDLARNNKCAVLYTYGGKTTLVTQNMWNEDSGVPADPTKIVSVFRLINQDKAEVKLEKSPKSDYTIRLLRDKTQESHGTFMTRAQRLSKGLNALLNPEHRRFKMNHTTGEITFRPSYDSLPSRLLNEISKQQEQQRQPSRA